MDNLIGDSDYLLILKKNDSVYEIFHDDAFPFSVTSERKNSYLENLILSHINDTEITELPKYRQLPCRTFISTGSCPYRERCVFIHDPRLITSKKVKTKSIVSNINIIYKPNGYYYDILLSQKKPIEDVCTDALFWPTMSRDDVTKKLNTKNGIISYFIC
jgi:hypothetical protein